MIKYPERHSEFEIQAHIYGVLRGAGYDVRGEVRFNGRGERNGRLDLVVFDDAQLPIAIVECKREAVRRRRKDIGEYKQIQRYEALFDVPVFTIDSMDKVETQRVLALIDGAFVIE